VLVYLVLETKIIPIRSPNETTVYVICSYPSTENVKISHAVLHAGKYPPITSNLDRCFLVRFSFLWLKMVKSSGEKKNQRNKKGERRRTLLKGRSADGSASILPKSDPSQNPTPLFWQIYQCKQTIIFPNAFSDVFV